MPNTHSKSLPTLDYVSIVASLYKDRRAMLVGMFATIFGVLTAGFKTGAVVLFLHAGLFALVTVLRYINMRRFERERPAPDDRDAAKVWERRAMVLGFFSAFFYGTWCFSTLVMVRDPFAELMAISVTIAAMIGIATRNFGIDSIVTVQSIASAVPMALGLVMVGDVFHLILACLLIPLMISFRFLAADVRGMLLAAVHGRVAASRLADQLDTALETMQHGLCMLDENGVIALANDRAQQTFAGIAAGAWVGRTFADLMEEAIVRRALPKATAERLLRMIEQQSGGKVVLKLSGDFYCEVTVSSRSDRTVLLFENVTQRVRTQERINFMARNDVLTGLPNRTNFTELADADLAARARMERISPAVLMIIDLDDFKHVNDSLGHLVGDKVLIETARRISDAAHPSSRLARFGGDEFVLYRSEAVNHSAGGAEASAILSAIVQPFNIGHERIDLRASIGYVTTTEADISLDELTARADLALYRAKARGKGQIESFHETMDAEFRYRQRLKVDLGMAIEAGQLRLAYQPLVDLATRKVAGCEALLRWTHPDLGPIPPSVFIPLAEEIGVISKITRFVLKKACAECRNWPDPIGVSVNVSARDLRSDMLVRSITRALKETGLSAHRLEIEVTETALIEERALALKHLRAIAELGVSIALDDFGTGYSSLSYLREMPFRKLKIDQSFVADITSDPRALRLMANVARLGKDLDLILTAEGVETEEQLALISEKTNIDQVQGYLFGMALPSGDIATLIASLEQSARPHLRLAKSD
ncbi:putative bifunctional diguanylate cyclase/phosphodiesterase [Pelagibacterium lentulum]|uniref:Diguanylate cyclase n=1 Tax=Pelagibacterium lentulum TaxID=2029865 RepID=A0A916VUU1_9HYPH|nr:EAL domain-containing protein [Pelagibacterium lentulum]GGA37105.1 diguanylate cyclase [Pelagibacterium lentulum]